MSGVVDTVNNFSEVSLTPAINFGFLVIYDRYQRHRGKDTGDKLFTGVNDTTINCIDDRGLLLLQNYLRPPKSATVTDIVIGTAMKTRKGTSQTLIRTAIATSNQNSII
jgi:hypothetical protein